MAGGLIGSPIEADEQQYRVMAITSVDALDPGSRKEYSRGVEAKDGPRPHTDIGRAQEDAPDRPRMVVDSAWPLAKATRRQRELLGRLVRATIDKHPGHPDQQVHDPTKGHGAIPDPGKARQYGQQWMTGVGKQNGFEYSARISQASRELLANPAAYNPQDKVHQAAASLINAVNKADAVDEIWRGLRLATKPDFAPGQSVLWPLSSVGTKAVAQNFAAGEGFPVIAEVRGAKVLMLTAREGVTYGNFVVREVAEESFTNSLGITVDNAIRVVLEPVDDSARPLARATIDEADAVPVGRRPVTSSPSAHKPRPARAQ